MWSGVYTPRGAAPAVSAGDKGSFGRAPRARPGNVAPSCRSCASLSSYVKVSIDTTLERGATFYGARFEFRRAVGMRRGVGESGRRPVGSIIKIKRSWRGAATGPGPGPPHRHSMCDPKKCPLYPLPVRHPSTHLKNGDDAPFQRARGQHARTPPRSCGRNRRWDSVERAAAAHRAARR